MKYLCLVYEEEAKVDALPEHESSTITDEDLDYLEELHWSGHYLGASPLHLTPTATSVRVRDGKRLVTDGPFAETREQLGGYYLIDASDLDEAIDIAARIPGVRWGTVEIRPVMEIAGLPEDEQLD